MLKLKYKSKNLDDTKKLALIIAKIAKPNLILLLNGPIGSGKTQLTKIIGAQCGITSVINSPTFIISNQYQTTAPWKLIHIDAYRLTNNNNCDEYYELLTDNFTIIEWPEKLNFNFKDYSYLNLTFTIKNNLKRDIVITTHLLKARDEQYLIKALKKED